jgi:hypothetical protein
VFVARCRYLCSFVCVCALVGASAGAAWGVPDPPDGRDAAWRRPVAGGVARAFEPPRSRYGPGHLGVDFLAAPGTPVGAAGPGEVSFAGTVGGSLHVVVAHAGGLRTSYSFLAGVAVRRGQTVRAGTTLGTSGGTGANHGRDVVHFGLRSGDTYVDPMLLFGAVDLARVVHLAPTAEPFGYSVAEERRGLLAGLQGGVSRVAGYAAAALDGALDLAPEVEDALVAALTPAAELGELLADRSTERLRRTLAGLPPTTALGLAIAAGLVLRTYWHERRDCDPDAPPADGSGGSGHRALLVAGIDSRLEAGSRSLDLPVERLGYRTDEVASFSYAADGGPYEREDTYAPLLVSSQRLGAQLRDAQRRHPGREVDLIAHSQGGVVVLAFLKLVYDPGDPSYPPLGRVVTLSSPLAGAPLATLAGAIRELPVVGEAGADAVDALPDAVPLPELDSPAVVDLAEQSTLMDRLAAAPLPESVQLTTIGSLFDYVVPADRATAEGARHVIVDAGAIDPHGAVLVDDDALRVVRAAIESRPVPCPSLRDVVRSSLIPPAITLGETVTSDLPGTPGWFVPRG